MGTVPKSRKWAATEAIAGAVVVLGQRALFDIPTVLVALVSLGLPCRFKVTEPVLMTAAGVAGLVLRPMHAERSEIIERELDKMGRLGLSLLSDLVMEALDEFLERQAFILLEIIIPAPDTIRFWDRIPALELRKREDLQPDDLVSVLVVWAASRQDAQLRIGRRVGHDMPNVTSANEEHIAVRRPR